MIKIQSIALQNHKLNFCFNRLVEVNTKKLLEVALYLQPRKGTLPRETNNISCQSYATLESQVRPNWSFDQTHFQLFRLQIKGYHGDIYTKHFHFFFIRSHTSHTSKHRDKNESALRSYRYELMIMRQFQLFLQKEVRLIYFQSRSHSLRVE